VHHQASPGASTTHTGFLADGQGDPRAAFIEALLNAIGSVGDIIAYSLPFESAEYSIAMSTIENSESPPLSLNSRCNGSICQTSLSSKENSLAASLS